MANTNVSREEVKSICNGLEVSPSKSDSMGKAGGKPSITPGHRSEGKTPGTMDFQYKGVPGFKGGFAKGARQE